MKLEVNNIKINTYMTDAYVVYILVKNGKPIYIGKTQSLTSRIIAHTKKKDFDEYIIAGCYSDWATAGFHERVLIDFAIKFLDVKNKLHKKYLHVITI